MYGMRGAMLGGEGISDDYEIGSKRPRMMESNPYFAVNSGYRQSYGGAFNGGSSYDGSSSYNGGMGYNSGGGYHQAYGGSSYRPSYGSSSYSGSTGTFSFPVVRLRGLPFSCTVLDIYKFFAGLDVVDTLLVNKNGLFTGEAFVVLSSSMQAEAALRRNRQNMGHRYVEVFICTKHDYYNAIANEVNSGGGNEYRQSPPPRPKKPQEDVEQMEYTEILKLRGLPYSVTKKEIADFFGDYELKEDNVHIVIRADGKATGEAFATFDSADTAKKAMSKDRMVIGTRYVELFPSTPEEAKKAASRSKW